MVLGGYTYTLQHNHLLKTWQEELKHLSRIFKFLEEANPIIKLSKCKFLAKSVNYLDHNISEEGIQPDPEKVKNSLIKKNQKQLKSYRNS